MNVADLYRRDPSQRCFSRTRPGTSTKPNDWGTRAERLPRYRLESKLMHGAGVRRALAFGVGALALEATGSVFHAYVVQDAPMSPEKMLRGDFLVAGLAGAAMLGWQGLGRGAGGSRAVLAFGLGFLFALFLELLNDAFPGALFRPKDIVGAVGAWSYVLLGTLGASAILSRGGVPKGTP